MKQPRIKRTPIAAGVALALGTTGAVAQEVLEEVVVTGIRGSLTSSMNLKRDSQGLVDGIISEDIGKFPDTNLAEAMQRIAGVSIDRSAIGEGQNVTVRGVGPHFNLVTLNGRQMPASSILDTAASSSRAFDFANLASEAIAAVEIQKTSRSSIPTGGIGATVNIRTARPLDNPDTIANFGVKGVLDQSTTFGDATTPEISGIFSTSNDDNTLGVAVTASYQDRALGYNQAGVPNGWRAFRGDEVNWGTIPLPGAPGSENIVNRPDPTDLYSVPQNALYSFNEVQRERTNGQLALQFRPSDTVTGTLDYTYSENKLATQRSELSAWYNFGPGHSTWTDGPVASPLIYSENFNGGDLCSGGATYATASENNSLGLNLEWDVSDRFGLEFDHHSSDAETGADSPYGSNVAIGACGFYRGNTTVDFSGDFPILQIDLPPGLTGVDRTKMLLTGRSFRNSYMRSEIEQTRVSGFFDFSDESSLDFGVVATGVDNRSAFSNVQTDSWGGFGSAADYPDDIWGTVESVPARFDNMPGSGNPNLFPEYFRWDFEDIRRAGVAVANGNPTSFQATDNFTTDRRTNEDSISAYVQYNHSFDIGDRPANIAAGVRYEQTDVVSSALVPSYTHIDWVAPNEFSAVTDGTTAFTTLTGEYDYILPSIDFDVGVRDDMIIRASYGESIGRPGWNDIQGGQTIGQLVRIDGGNGNQGDPGLLPLESQNLDFSLEWYYDDSSYFAVSYFQKDIDNYVGIAFIEDTPFDLAHPGQGSRYQEARAAVGNDLTDIRTYIFENYGDTPSVTQTGVDSNGNPMGTITGVAGEDPVAVFQVAVPSNQRSATLDGLEVSLQHMFGDSGFGGSVNFTVVDSDLTYDNASKDDQFALEGLSDSANLVVFYEDYGWSARVAYNWRDEFLTSRFDSERPNPLYTDEYGQWDMNVSYDVNDALTVFAEGINVTDEIQRIRGRAPQQTFFVTQTGARFMIGARYDFR